MANDSFTQQALGADASFQARVRSALSSVAFQVLAEPPETPSHAARATYARSVITNLQGTAVQAAGWLVGRPNLLGAATSYDFQSRSVVTAATDAALESQIMTDWNFLAGILAAPPSA